MVDPVHNTAAITNQHAYLVDDTLFAFDADPAQPRHQDQPVYDLARFLSGLRTAWQRGDVRPTSAAKPKVKRGRRRADPLVSVTEQSRVWFLAEPWKTSRGLLDRLQAEHPGDYPDGRPRTLQRRVKGWRMEHARALSLGGVADPAPPHADGTSGASA